MPRKPQVTKMSTTRKRVRDENYQPSLFPSPEKFAGKFKIPRYTACQRSIARSQGP